MRASPPCDCQVGTVGRWRLAVTLVALAGLGCLAAWGASSPAVSMLTWGVLAAAGVAVVATAFALTRDDPGRLAWDGACWRLALGGSGSRPEETGRVQVAIDLGNFMLLRFVADARADGDVRWLALERRGAQPAWHAMRCALFSAPVAGLGPGSPARE